MIGDSLSAQSAWAFDVVGTNRGFFTLVDARSGALTRDQQPAADRIAPTRPAAAVISLGTNDAVCALANSLRGIVCPMEAVFSLADMTADLTRMATTLRATGTCVVGVNVYFGTEVGDAFDELVAAGLVRGVIDWRSVILADERLRSDGLGHLTVAGQNAMGARVIDETARICGL